MSKLKEIQLNSIGQFNNFSKFYPNFINSNKQNSYLWVDKYRPQTASQMLGQQGEKSCLNKLIFWLKNWNKNRNKICLKNLKSNDGSEFKAALLSGPTGIGKTLGANLACKELGLDVCDLNASNSRNKKLLETKIKDLLCNNKLNFFDNRNLSNHVLIMDEIDGISGNEDRGCVNVIIQFIKITKVPIICICNDRFNSKIRSLANHCFDLRFFKPSIDQIKSLLVNIVTLECLKIKHNSLSEIIVSSNQDVRQSLHTLYLISTGGNLKEIYLSNKTKKDVRLGTFEAIKKIFVSGEEYDKMNFQNKSDIFFVDHSIMPLFVFENYINFVPKLTKKANELSILEFASDAIDSIVYGDIIDREIRYNQSWNLLPIQAAFAIVIPSSYMNGYLIKNINFPSFLGKLSTIQKNERLLLELKTHMAFIVNGNKTALILEYLEPLREKIVSNLQKNEPNCFSNVINILKTNYMVKEDIESIVDLTKWNNQIDLFSKIDKKTKIALTKAYKLEFKLYPYSKNTYNQTKNSYTNHEINFDLIDEKNQSDSENDALKDGDDCLIKITKKRNFKNDKRVIKKFLKN